jgi:hypothetical protein
MRWERRAGGVMWLAALTCDWWAGNKPWWVILAACFLLTVIANTLILRNWR